MFEIDKLALLCICIEIIMCVRISHNISSNVHV